MTKLVWIENRLLFKITKSLPKVILCICNNTYKSDLELEVGDIIFLKTGDRPRTWERLGAILAFATPNKVIIGSMSEIKSGPKNVVQKLHYETVSRENIPSAEEVIGELLSEQYEEESVNDEDKTVSEELPVSMKACMTMKPEDLDSNTYMYIQYYWSEYYSLKELLSETERKYEKQSDTFMSSYRDFTNAFNSWDRRNPDDLQIIVEDKYRLCLHYNKIINKATAKIQRMEEMYKEYMYEHGFDMNERINCDENLYNFIHGIKV